MPRAVCPVLAAGVAGLLKLQTNESVDGFAGAGQPGAANKTISVPTPDTKVVMLRSEAQALLAYSMILV